MWIVCAALAISAYFHHFERPPYHPSWWTVFQHPLGYPLYVLEYLGQPVCAFHGSAAAGAGVVGLLAWAGLLLALHRQGLPTAQWAAYLGLGLYAILTACVTGMARVDLGGPAQAMSSRYVTMANLLWVGVAVLGAECFADREGETPRRRTLRAGLFAGLLLLSSVYGAYRWTERYHAYAPARQELLEGEGETLLKRLYPDVPRLIERREVLKAHRLTLFSGVRE